MKGGRFCGSFVLPSRAAPSPPFGCYSEGSAAGAPDCGRMNNETARDNNLLFLFLVGVNLQRNYRSSSWSKWSWGKSWRENSSIWKVGSSLICNLHYILSTVPKVQECAFKCATIWLGPRCSSDNFQDQMKRELSYREEMVQQLQIVRGSSLFGLLSLTHRRVL